MERVIIVDSDPRELMELTVALNAMRFGVTAIEPLVPLTAATRLARQCPAAMVVALSGDENLAEVRSLLERAHQTKIVFLVPAMPPKAALVRIVNEHGATVLAQEEAPLVLAATLVALLAQRSYGVA